MWNSATHLCTLYDVLKRSIAWSVFKNILWAIALSYPRTNEGLFYVDPVTLANICSSSVGTCSRVIVFCVSTTLKLLPLHLLSVQQSLRNWRCDNLKITNPLTLVLFLLCSALDISYVTAQPAGYLCSLERTYCWTLRYGILSLF